jgi:hypothetical protein
MAIEMAHLDQARGEIHTFDERLTSWLDEVRKADVTRQHENQIGVLGVLMGGIVKDLRAELTQSETKNGAELHDACINVELKVAWLRRLFGFWAERFHRADSVKSLLAVADDVIWSCYAEVADRGVGLGFGLRTSVSPLGFLSSEYSPSALPSTWVPRELRQGTDTFDKSLDRLPLSVVRLPATTERAPWLLVFAAHEAGHCLQGELIPQPLTAPDKTLSVLYRTALHDAVPGDGALWESWADEIFADAVAAMLMGRAALIGLAEVHWRSPDRLEQAAAGYPHGALRLKLMAELLRQLGLDGDGVLQGIDLEKPLSRPELKKKSAAIPPIVDVLLGPVPGTCAGAKVTLRDLCGFKLEQFSRTHTIKPGQKSTARLLVSRAVEDWVVAAAVPNDNQRRAALHTLGSALVKKMNEQRHTGFRTARSAAVIDVHALTAEFCQELDTALRGEGY